MIAEEQHLKTSITGGRTRANPHLIMKSNTHHHRRRHPFCLCTSLLLHLDGNKTQCSMPFHYRSLGIMRQDHDERQRRRRCWGKKEEGKEKVYLRLSFFFASGTINVCSTYKLKLAIILARAKPSSLFSG